MLCKVLACSLQLKLLEEGFTGTALGQMCVKPGAGCCPVGICLIGVKQR